MEHYPEHFCPQQPQIRLPRRRLNSYLSSYTFLLNITITINIPPHTAVHFLQKKRQPNN